MIGKVVMHRVRRNVDAGDALAAEINIFSSDIARAIVEAYVAVPAWSARDVRWPMAFAPESYV